MTTTVNANGNTYTDGSDPNTGMGNYGWRKRLLPMLSDVMVDVGAKLLNITGIQTDVTSKQASASTAATTASTAATTATQQAAIAVAAANTAAGIVQSVDVVDRAGIPPIVDFPFSGPSAVPSGVITGSSGKWVMGQSGLLTYVPAGTAPIDYDPVTAALRGLPVEESRTNLLTYSQAFDNAAWTALSSTVTANTVTAPDGTLTADTLAIGSGGQVFHSVAGIATTTTHTFSVWVRAASTTSVRLKRYNQSAGADLYSSDIAVTTEWQRISFTFTTGAATSVFNVSLLVPSSGSAVTVYAWGAQLEVGAYPTSYIPTASSTVTRAADVNTLALSSITGWNGIEGTIYVEADFPTPSGYPAAVSIDDGTSGNFVRVIGAANSTTILAEVMTGGVTQTALSIGTMTPSTTFRAALAFKGNDIAACLAGGAVATDTSATLPTVTQIRIGSGSGGQINGHIRRLTIFPRRLSNATLQLLTA